MGRNAARAGPGRVGVSADLRRALVARPFVCFDNRSLTIDDRSNYRRLTFADRVRDPRRETRW